MRKLVFLSLVLAILALMLIGCEKPDQPVPPEPTPVFYTLSSTVSGKGSVSPDKQSGIALGSSVTVKFIPEVGHSFYSAKVNGVSIDVQPSTTEVSYTIRDINKDPRVEAVFVETDILIFSVKSTAESPWMWTKFDVHRASDNTFLRSPALSQAEKTDKYYFLYPSKTTIVLEQDGGVRNGVWDLKQRNVQFDSQSGRLDSLTKNKFTYVAKPIWGQVDSCYVYAVYTFERK